MAGDVVSTLGAPVTPIPTPVSVEISAAELTMTTPDGEELRRVFVEYTFATVVGPVVLYLHPEQAIELGVESRRVGKAALGHAAPELVTPPKGLFLPGAR